MSLIIHPEPHEDEGPCGYLTRLAYLNKIEPAFLFDEANIVPSLVFSRGLREEYVKRISTFSKASQQRVCDLLSFPSVKGQTEWQPNGIYFRQETHANHIAFDRPKICPQCVNEQDYWNKSWEFSVVPSCAKHHLLLLDRCTECETMFEWTKTYFDRCHNCDKEIKLMNKLVPSGDSKCRLSHMAETLLKGGDIKSLYKPKFYEYIKGLSFETLTSMMIPLVAIRTSSFNKKPQSWLKLGIPNLEFEKISSWAIKLLSNKDKDIEEFITDMIAGFGGLPGPQSGLVALEPLRNIQNKLFPMEPNISTRLQKIFIELYILYQKNAYPIAKCRDRILYPELPGENDALDREQALQFLSIREPYLDVIMDRCLRKVDELDDTDLEDEENPIETQAETISSFTAKDLRQIRTVQQRLLTRDQVEKMLGIGPDALKSLDQEGILCPRIRAIDNTVHPTFRRLVGHDAALLSSRW